MRMELKELHRQIGKTTVYVTHDQVEAMTLATRVAVMHQGEIQQFDRPEVVYNRPANLFVAGFMGSPAMNIVSARIERAGAKLEAVIGQGTPHPKRLTLPCDYTAEGWIGRDVVIGIRPECITEARGGPSPVIQARVTMTETTGPETIAVLEIGGQKLLAKISPDTRLAVGEIGEFEIDTGKIALFDPQTEKLIIDGPTRPDLTTGRPTHSAASHITTETSMANKIKEIWAQGGTAISGWLSIPSGYAAEVMAKAGYDALTVDMQHGVQDYQSLVACYQAISAQGPAPMVRVPWREPGIIGKVLDAGAVGVICPMVNTPQEAKELVSYIRYPPIGARSHGPIRVGAYGEAGSYYQTANTDMICMPMIETETAVNNIDAIIDVAGVDAVYVGPGDLGFSIGLPPRIDREEPEILKFYERILRACERRGIYAGLHNSSPAYAIRMMEMGFRFLVLGSDSGVLLRGARSDVEASCRCPQRPRENPKKRRVKFLFVTAVRRRAEAVAAPSLRPRDR